ncbi:MAG: hypothetical protein QOE98_634 [Gaiellaceae bacterium]|nr:hypothetical protein [Gaiellaceae bacterium]
MRRTWPLALLMPLLLTACGSADRTIEQNQVGSTQAAVAATPTGVANCGRYPVPRRMSQYVNVVESDALPQYIANPIDSPCRLSVSTLIESVPECLTGTPADRATVLDITNRVRGQIESGVPPDQAYAVIRDQARELANRKAC